MNEFRSAFAYPLLVRVSWRHVFRVVILAALVLFTAQANLAMAQHGNLGSMPVIVGQSLQAKDAHSTKLPPPKTDKSDELKTRPIGSRIFKAIVEVAHPDEFKPGEAVDVSLVTLRSEGSHTETILRKVLIHSVDKVPGTDSQGPPPEEAADAPIVIEHGHAHPEVFPTRVVGLVVNGGQLEKIRLAEAHGQLRLSIHHDAAPTNMASSIATNFVTNLFQPLLLFFFMGFAIPLLKVPFEFPKALYQSLTIYLLVAIGWHGGELMAELPSSELAVAGGLAAVGFIVNGSIGLIATWMLRAFTPMRRIDAVTVGSYYGSDSAGTFVTCLGILATLGLLHDSYMPVMLAVMEIPGCLVGLFLISRLRQSGMDKLGNMPNEPGYVGELLAEDDPYNIDTENPLNDTEVIQPVAKSVGAAAAPSHKGGGLNLKILHEVFLNPGLYMLFGGIIVGYISGRQALVDPHVVEGPNNLFLMMFKGALCLFLLEMGITACQRLGDLKTAGVGFIIFGVLAPVLFATIGMVALHAYSLVLGHAFETGTYALFAVLCGAASYIAVPAVQRIAIPEASPTLPLAASLGLTFTWNVTLGIPIYIEIAKHIIQWMPVS
ncbi:sodium-dependent bicarbonate transport family permease [Bremerella sp. JC770]|uniref:sodium-dependent bicarbonate transport family permease n=1 Tax=Bremerella sp. JC770 TaxID=3232137 RepID=UPI003457AAF2